MTKIVHVVGARPNFMKVAPMMAALAERTDIEQRLVHTGQHYDKQLSGAFFEDLELPEADDFLGVGSGSHAEQAARIMLALEPVSEGTNCVLGTGAKALAEFRAALEQPLERRPRTPEGWDGEAATRAADAVAERYGALVGRR